MGGKGQRVDFICRYYFYADAHWVRVFFTFRNPHKHNHPGNIWDLGQGGSIFVEDFSLLIPLRRGVCERFEISAGPRTVKGEGLEEVTLWQDSSGGENWNSVNHINKDYKVPFTFRGWRVYKAGRVVEQGQRTEGWLHTSGPEGGVAVSVKDFWQNFPKALSLRKSLIRIGLWPGEFGDSHEILGGEQKTYELFFLFHGPGISPKTVRARIKSFNRCLVPVPDLHHVLESEALGLSAPLDRERFRKLEATCDSAFEPRKGKESFVTKWELIDEYGWRHWGDTFADNERAPSSMVKDFPKYHIGSIPIGHYVNEYGVISAVMLQGIRRQSPLWLYYGDAMARHHADICVYHAEDDVPAYSYGPFMHTTHETAAYRSTFRSYPIEAKRYGLRYGQGGGPNAGHTYVDCLAYHWLLTGNRTSLDSFLEVANWACESPWFSPRMMGDRRGYGNFLRTFVLAYRLTGKKRYYRKAMTLMSWVKEPFSGLGGTLFVEALHSFLRLKRDLHQLDEDYRLAQDLVLKFGEYYLKLPAKSWERFLEQRAFHSLVLCIAYLDAPSDYPHREAFKERGLSIVLEALQQFPGRYVPTKTWVMCFGKLGPFLKVAQKNRKSKRN